MAGARMDAIGIVVSDMAASVAFYRRLGLAYPDEALTDDHAEVELAGGVRLMLDSEEMVRSFEPDWAASGAGRITLAVSLPTPADVDALYADLAADGHGKTLPWDAFWGQRYAAVTDPDGNTIDLYSPLPPT